jgi:hypothetical protein
MANLNFSSLMEAFALAAGTPPSVWRVVPDHTTATAQLSHEASAAETQNSDRWGTPVPALREGNHDE